MHYAKPTDRQVRALSERLPMGQDENVNPLPAARLERMIGKPSRDWTVDDLIEVVREQRIRVISLMHIGGDGWLKTLDFVPRDFSHLRDVLRAGERADGSSLFGMMGIDTTASDVVLRPKLHTAFIDPFAPLPTLALLCGHLGRDGAPLPESPDTIVRYAYNRALHEIGVELQALGEVEYFLGKHPDESDAYGADDRGYHATSPFVFGEGLRREAITLLAEFGIPVKYAHSEVGYIEATEDDPYIWEQHEVELALMPLPRAAEAVVLTMWVLRNLAHRYGMRCTFDPIVRKGHAGSGMHFHCSPVVKGEHVGGEDENGQMFDPGKWLIAGLGKVGGALMAFGNTVEGSFIRLTQGKEAPNTVTWGKYNRKTLIRLPVVARDEEGKAVSPPTIEFRLPDGSAHPHLLLAGIAQGMIYGKTLDDLDEFLEKTKFDPDGAGVAKVPRTMPEVAKELEANRKILEDGAVFPPNVIKRLIDTLKDA